MFAGKRPAPFAQGTRPFLQVRLLFLLRLQKELELQRWIWDCETLRRSHNCNSSSEASKSDVVVNPCQRRLSPRKTVSGSIGSSSCSSTHNITPGQTISNDTTSRYFGLTRDMSSIAEASRFVLSRSPRLRYSADSGGTLVIQQCLVQANKAILISQIVTQQLNVPQSMTRSLRQDLGAVTVTNGFGLPQPAENVAAENVAQLIHADPVGS